MNHYAFSEPLHTERLVLRRFADRDYDALYAIRSDAESARYLYHDPQTPDQVRETLARKISSVSIAASGDVLALAAEDRATGAMVADVILALASEEHLLGEVGYMVHPGHAGKGYATEATRPLLGIAFDALGLHRVIGRLEARNGASARVLEKLGMRCEAHLIENEWVKGEWQSELVYAILEREWRASRPIRG